MQVSEKVQRVFEQMNRLGQERKPFLFVIDYACEEAFLYENPKEQRDVLFSINAHTNLPTSEEQTFSKEEVPQESLLTMSPITAEEYHPRFKRIQAALKRGDSFLANLTIASPIVTPLSLEEIYHRANAPYKICVPHRFVCFSPESFVTIDLERLRIETYPMKGTIDAQIPNAKEEILNNYKETAEHYTIVDLMRNDLSQVAENTRVEDFRYIDRLKTIRGELLQVSSRVVADLNPSKADQLGDIIAALLPAGSISGAPKQATVQAIAEAEAESRGFYTGVVGYFDGRKLDSGVLIRFIEERENGERFYRSGGGITINSSETEEYQEALQKVYLPF